MNKDELTFPVAVEMVILSMSNESWNSCVSWKIVIVGRASLLDMTCIPCEVGQEVGAILEKEKERGGCAITMRGHLHPHMRYITHGADHVTHIDWLRL